MPLFLDCNVRWFFEKAIQWPYVQFATEKHYVIGLECRQTIASMSNTPTLLRSTKGKFSSFDSYGSLSALAIRRVAFTDRMLHLIREKIHTYPQEAIPVNGSFDSQFVHLIKSTVNNFGGQSSASALVETEKMCIFFVLNVENHQKCFLKTRALHSSCSKGNIDRS